MFAAMRCPDARRAFQSKPKRAATAPRQVSHGSGVRCLDVSLDRARLALVDEGGRVVVYDLATQARGSPCPRGCLP
jgi:hypothetical protein